MVAAENGIERPNRGLESGHVSISATDVNTEPGAAVAEPNTTRATHNPVGIRGRIDRWRRRNDDGRCYWNRWRHWNRRGSVHRRIHVRGRDNHRRWGEYRDAETWSTIAVMMVMSPSMVGTRGLHGDC